MGIVSKAKVKKQLRGVIYVEDDDGNLVKYIRVRDKENGKPKHHEKLSLRKPTSPMAVPRKAAPRQNASKKPKSNINATLLPSKRSIRVNVRKSKRNVKGTSPSPPPPITTPEPPTLKPYEIDAAKMNNCSVVLRSMTENDIVKEVERLKRQCKIDKIKEKLKQLSLLEVCEFKQYAYSIEPLMQGKNGSINFESVSDGALQLMHQYSTKDSHSTDISINATATGGFVVCLPDFGKIVISMPLWKSCALNPLQHPMFMLGESWTIDLQTDGSLSLALPELNGKRETFIFSERVWHSWLGNDEQIYDRSSLQLHSNQNESVEGTNSNTSLSILSISTSEIAKLLEGEDDILAALLSMDWNFDPQMSIGAASMNSICKQIQPTIIDQSLVSTHDDNDETGQDGYDASIEASDDESDE